jgi:hypothetical protein
MIYISANGGQIFQTLVREKLTANRTYYVRPDGNDNNDGLEDSASRAFLTIQKAVDVVCETLDMGRYQVTIQCGSGTYTGNVVLSSWVGKLTPILRGDAANHSAVVVTSTSGVTIQLSVPSSWTLQDLEIRSNASTGTSLQAAFSCVIYLDGVNFGAGRYHIEPILGATIQILSNYTISSGCQRHINCKFSGNLTAYGVTVTLSGSPAWATAFVLCAYGAVEMLSVTFSGVSTGTRYSLLANGLLSTGGGGANYFPGSLAGTTVTGGQYI